MDCGVRWTLVTFLLLVAWRDSQATFNGYNMTANYSKRVSPGKYNAEGKPLIVSVQIRIMDILKVDESNSEMEVDLVINRRWVEPRIEFTQEIQNDDPYPVDPTDEKKFWVPDLYIRGMREFKIMEGMNHLILYSNKTINNLLRATASLKCPFHFEMFPLDSQHCKFDFISPLQPLEDQKLVWWTGGEPAEFYRRVPHWKLALPEFEARLVVCNESLVVNHIAGKVSAVRLWIVLDRHFKSHVLETYVPTTIFVIMSWGSFLVKPDMVPGRMVLLVTNLLSLVTLFEASQVSSPPANGIKCLDIWLVSCIMFVFFAMLEYAIILYKLRGSFFQQRVVKLLIRTPPKNGSKSQSFRPGIVPKLRAAARKVTWALSHSRYRLSGPAETAWNHFDQVSLILFPFVFLFFCIGYWCTYLSKSWEMLPEHQCNLA